jgi:hypothetical protein
VIVDLLVLHSHGPALVPSSANSELRFSHCRLAIARGHLVRIGKLGAHPSHGRIAILKL